MKHFHSIIIDVVDHHHQTLAMKVCNRNLYIASVYFFHVRVNSKMYLNIVFIYKEIYVTLDHKTILLVIKY